MSVRQHKVMPGDSLDSISQAYYETPKYGDFIGEHNRDVLVNPNMLDVGLVLAIPYLPQMHKFLEFLDG